MTLILGVVACALALTMAISSGFALYRAEHSGRDGRAFVLPVFVGIAYVVLQGLMLHDVANNGQPQYSAQIMSRVIETMLIISVILLLHRGAKRRG